MHFVHINKFNNGLVAKNRNKICVMYLLAASFMQLIHSKQTFLPYMPTSDYNF